MVSSHANELEPRGCVCVCCVCVGGVGFLSGYHCVLRFMTTPHAPCARAYWIADWCLQSDVVPESRRQGLRLTLHHDEAGPVSGYRRWCSGLAISLDFVDFVDFDPFIPPLCVKTLVCCVVYLLYISIDHVCPVRQLRHCCEHEGVFSMSAPCHLTAPCNELYLVTMFAACLQSGFWGVFFGCARSISSGTSTLF